MKIILSLFAVIAFTASSYAQSGPKIELKFDTVDYGNAAKGSDKGIRTIDFTNTGDAPLIITDVKSTASSIVPTWPKEAILPGKSAKIEIKYNMAPGPLRKTVTIHCNAVNYTGGVVPIKIKGDIK